MRRQGWSRGALHLEPRGTGRFGDPGDPTQRSQRGRSVNTCFAIAAYVVPSRGEPAGGPASPASTAGHMDADLLAPSVFGSAVSQVSQEASNSAISFSTCSLVPP